MISQQLIQELKTILQEENGLDLQNQDVEAVGNQLVSGYEALIRLERSDIQE